jgi:predicted RNA-binding protein
MYLINIINDLYIGGKNYDANKIKELLFNKKIWVFNSNTPFINKLKKGDKVILYLAGKGRRKFVAKYELSSSPKVIEEEIKHLFNNNFIDFFRYYIRIKNIEEFKNKINIVDIKEDLDFIKDKKNYGLFLRQSLKKLSKKDYNYIVNKNI